MSVEPDFAELERRLATRTAEVAAAHRRIEELLGKTSALKEAKRKLTEARQERDALRASAEYRLGRKLLLPFRKLARAFAGKPQADPAKPRPARAYHEWLLAHRPTPAELDAMRRASEQWPGPVLISIVMPVRNPVESALDQAVASVRDQAYPHWELLVADDASEDPRIAARLQALAAQEPRIRLKFLEQSPGPALASNAAIEMASGDFIGLLDQEDSLEPETLFEIARLIRETPEADILYSDADSIDEAGRFHDPFFKPDWSPDALLSDNYLARFTVLRRSLFTAAGGFRDGFAGAHEYDLLLRATERARGILHVPKVLAHSRAGSLRTPGAIESGAKALEEALARRGIRGEVLNAGPGSRYRVRRAIADTARVAIIIPTRDRVELLSRCVRSIVDRTDYPNYEIVIADNDSQDPEAVRYRESLPHRVLHFAGPFNYAAINNYAVRQTDAPWILFLNNDTEVIDPEWLTSMAEHIQRAEVGAVGAKLLYPNNTVQHAGVLLAEKSAPDHAYRAAPADSLENGGQLQIIRNYSAVTAACMLTRRDVFEQVGGFDEMELPVSYNDVDYCLKLRKAGYLIVYTPFARLYHHESASRGRGTGDSAAGRLLRQRWAAEIARDPYGNPNLGWDAAES